LISFKCEATDLSNYTVHANIIYRLTKYIDWPDESNSGEFVIGIIGESPLFEELSALSKGKKVGNQPIVVRYLSPDAQSYKAQILFISENQSGNLKRIANITEGHPTLIVSERNNLISKGSCINLKVIGEQLKLEFGKSNIERRNLKVASELLRLGVIVN
jgi:hypothetical protein